MKQEKKRPMPEDEKTEQHQHAKVQTTPTRLNPLAKEFTPPATYPIHQIPHDHRANVAVVNPYSREAYYSQRGTMTRASGVMKGDIGYGEHSGNGGDQQSEKEMQKKRRKKRGKRKKNRASDPEEEDPNSYVARLKHGIAVEHGTKDKETGGEKMEVNEHVAVVRNDRSSLDSKRRSTSNGTSGKWASIARRTMERGTKYLPVPHAGREGHGGAAGASGKRDEEEATTPINVKTASIFKIGSLIATEIERQLLRQKRTKKTPTVIDYRKIPQPPKARKKDANMKKLMPMLHRSRKKRVKQPTTLKKIITREKRAREQRERERQEKKHALSRSNSTNIFDGHTGGDVDDEWETVDDSDQTILGDMATVFTTTTHISNSKSKKPEPHRNEKTKTVNTHGSPSHSLNEFDEKETDTSRDIAEKYDNSDVENDSVPTRNIREYVDHKPTREIDELITQFIYKLRYYQARVRVENPIMFEMRRKFVIGLKQTIRAVKNGKAVAVIIAPNIEVIESEGGLDELIYTLIEAARTSEIPIVYALKVKKLGRIFGKHKMSCMAIYRTDPAHDEFKSIVRLVNEQRSIFREKNPEWEETVYMKHYAVRKLQQKRTQDEESHNANTKYQNRMTFREKMKRKDSDGKRKKQKNLKRQSDDFPHLVKEEIQEHGNKNVQESDRKRRTIPGPRQDNK